MHGGMFGMAWHGMAWHGMAWHGMAWYGCMYASLYPVSLSKSQIASMFNI